MGGVEGAVVVVVVVVVFGGGWGWMGGTQSMCCMTLVTAEGT